MGCAQSSSASQPGATLVLNPVANEQTMPSTMYAEHHRANDADLQRESIGSPRTPIDQRIASLIELLSTSSLLRSAIPYVRQLALVETLRRCETWEVAKQICIENMAGSPYVPDEQKNRLVELVLLEQWDMVRQALQCRSTPGVVMPPKWRMYQSMVVELFTRSRKIRALPDARRCQLGQAIHSTMSIEGLKELAMVSLETSTTLTAQDRQQIANDLWDDRYDLLLLPDRFDCDEKPRQRPEVQHVGQQGVDADDDDECPICLGTNVVDRRLQCGHRMCHSCVDQWVARNQGSQFTCPMCRAPCHRSHVQAI